MELPFGLLLLIVIVAVGVLATRRRRPPPPIRVFVDDASRTIRAVRQLPRDVQFQIAKSVFDEVMASVQEIEATAPGSDRDAIVRLQLVDARARRYTALRQGAEDWSDPEWARTALIENWLMANSGTLGEEAFKEIDGLLMQWLRQVLGKRIS
ncbi:MAG: hypothetical protein OXU75_22290 [Deltaproteobacteria bacterium]|nr:hypothetical protein [Deltaproteobacteria bacterium]